ncbi:hypothetical protein GBAR_LOCUS15604 [Geodia barretti]|uniref:Uncharacterized protein n=1 Tax=Geodia barretti TaxID=519541 RepID=A0AA35WUL9_GEOBA|nr:hypothetical protein GBAR_LOCUS15604 [Geodia barretti]
MPRVVRSACA